MRKSISRSRCRRRRRLRLCYCSRARQNNSPLVWFARSPFLLSTVIRLFSVQEWMHVQVRYHAQMRLSILTHHNAENDAPFCHTTSDAIRRRRLVHAARGLRPE